VYPLLPTNECDFIGERSLCHDLFQMLHTLPPSRVLPRCCETRFHMALNTLHSLMSLAMRGMISSKPHFASITYNLQYHHLVPTHLPSPWTLLPLVPLPKLASRRLYASHIRLLFLNTISVSLHPTGLTSISPSTTTFQQNHDGSVGSATGDFPEDHRQPR